MNSLCIYVCIFCFSFFFIYFFVLQYEYGSLRLFRFIKLPYSRIQEDGFGIIQEGGRDIGVGIAAMFLCSPFVSSTMYLGTSKEILFRCAQNVLSMPIYTDNCFHYLDQ